MPTDRRSDVHVPLGGNDAVQASRSQVLLYHRSIQTSLSPPDQSRRDFGVSMSANRKGVLPASSKRDSKLKPNQKARVTPRSLAPPPLGAAWKKLRCLHYTFVQPFRRRSTCDSRRAVGEVPRYRRPDLEADHAHHRRAREVVAYTHETRGR